MVVWVRDPGEGRGAGRGVYARAAGRRPAARRDEARPREAPEVEDPWRFVDGQGAGLEVVRYDQVRPLGALGVVDARRWRRDAARRRPIRAVIRAAPSVWAPSWE